MLHNYYTPWHGSLEWMHFTSDDLWRPDIWPFTKTNMEIKRWWHIMLFFPYYFKLILNGFFSRKTCHYLSQNPTLIFSPVDILLEENLSEHSFLQPCKKKMKKENRRRKKTENVPFSPIATSAKFASPFLQKRNGGHVSPSPFSKTLQQFLGESSNSTINLLDVFELNFSEN